MTEPPGEQGSGSFEERLRAASARQQRDQPTSPSAESASAVPGSVMGIGLRVGIELVSALVVAVGIGWLLDRWLHTTPIFIAVFVLLGGAAGVLNVWRMMGGSARR